MQEKNQGTRQVCVQTTNKELGNKVCKKSRKALGRKVSNKRSTDLGKKGCKKGSKEQ